MPESPCPMPEVSTSTRPKPATLHAAMTSGRPFATSACAPRVASERMNTRPPPMAFMRMRSPSSAPPDLRREGSTASTAMSMRSLVEPEAAHELVGQRGLARAARAGDAQRRHRGGPGLLEHLRAQGRVETAILQRSEQPRECAPVSLLHRAEVARRVPRQILVAAREHVVDHALKAHFLAVFGRVDARDAVGLELT